MAAPFSAAAERNKKAIGDALAPTLAPQRGDINVLEIGSGTGQHADYFSERFAHLIWQPTDQHQYIDALTAVCSNLSRPNLLQPVELEVSTAENNPHALSGLLQAPYAFIYSSNTAHIMSIEEVGSLFVIVSRMLSASGTFALYGPFKIDGNHTSEGNVQFDQSLRLEKPSMGIRDKSELQILASKLGLLCVKDIPMPANNRLLLWRRE